MTLEKRRWFVVAGALLVQLCLGSIYAWGAFTKALEDPVGPFRFSETQAQAIFCAGIASSVIAMILAGRWQDRVGPRRMATLGGLLMAHGYLVAGFMGATKFWSLFLLLGVMSGAGTGLGYVCPIAACVSWFPDLKGFVTAFTVAGFGAGAFIFMKLAGSWGNLVSAHGVSRTFAVFGLIFIAAVGIGARLLSTPPEGWRPSGH